MTRVTALLTLLAALLIVPAAQAAGPVKAGAAVVDGTYNVGSSAGQYASTRDGGYGDPDPRGCSAASFEEVEHYCLDCRFRDWMDATGDLTPTVAFDDGRGKPATETVRAVDGDFRTSRAVRGGSAWRS